MPPITATASGELVSEPAPAPIAAGNIARTIVSEVISTGRMRIGQALRSRLDGPWNRPQEDLVQAAEVEAGLGE